MALRRVLQLGTAGPLYGAERWILALCRSLDPQRVQSRIAVINDLGAADDMAPLTSAAHALGFAVDEISAQGRINPTAIRQLRALVIKYNIESVHSHGDKADALALLAVLGTDTKVVATPHGWSHDAGYKLRFYEWLDRQMFRLTDAVAPLSPDLLQSIEPILGSRSKLTMIPNGVDLMGPIR